MSLAYYLDQDGVVAQFVAQMIPYARSRGFGPCAAIGMLIAHTKASNIQALRQLAVIGFKFEPFPRLYGRHEDGVTCRLTDDDWAASKFNKKGRASWPIAA
jgi:RimJ/RimL family protein N-acetyltransferase